MRDRQRLVDRDGEALVPRSPRLIEGERPTVGSGRRGVDADDLAGAVDQRASGVAWLHIGVDLDESGQLLTRAAEFVGCGDRLI